MTPEEFKEKMKRYGYVNRTLAEELGCSLMAVWRWKRGKARIMPYVDKFFERRELDEEDAQEAIQSACAHIMSIMVHMPKKLRLSVVDKLKELIEKDLK